MIDKEIIDRINKNSNDNEVKRGRIFLLGIDGGDLEIINDLIEDNLLQNFKKIKEEGSSGILNSTIFANSASAWASLFTGKDPSNHGIVYFQNQYEDRVEFFDCFLDTIEGERIWDVFSNAGYFSSVVNVPITYPPEKLNGIMVSGRLADEDKIYTFPDYLTTYLNNLNYYPVFEGLKGENKLFEILNRKINISLEVVKYLNWSFFFQGFEIIDYVLHKYSESSILENITGDDKISDLQVVRRAYKYLDEYLGKILKLLNKEDIIFIVSDHGFKKYDIFFNINIWLIRNGYLLLKEQSLRKFRDMLLYIPIRLKRKIFGQKNILGIRSPYFDFKRDVDWKRTIFYSTEYFVNCVPIRLNPYLKLSVDKRDMLFDKLKNELFELEYDGVKIIKKINHREDLFQGKYIKRMPDVIAILDDRVRNDKKIYGKSKIYDKNYSIEHRREGIFLAYGKNILNRRLEKPVRVEDILPTIAYLANLSCPEKIDGRVIKEIIEDEFLVKNFLKTHKEDKLKKIGKKKYGQKIKNKLEDLGYL